MVFGKFGLIVHLSQNVVCVCELSVPQCVSVYVCVPLCLPVSATVCVFVCVCVGSDEKNIE